MVTQGYLEDLRASFPDIGAKRIGIVRRVYFIQWMWHRITSDSVGFGGGRPFVCELGFATRQNKKFFASPILHYDGSSVPS